MQPYATIDVETTGVNLTHSQVIEFAVVIETDWRTPVEELPTLHLLVERAWIFGEPVALAMNGRIFAELAKPEKERACPTVRPEQVSKEIASFIALHITGTPTLAGKNLGTFDLMFLGQLPFWGDFKYRHRVIDPAMLYWRPDADDRIPGLEECLKRAGLGNDRPHHPVSDCRAVIELIRQRWL